MAWAIPADFKRIPVHVTAGMGALCRAPVELAAFIPIRRNLCQALAHDRAVAGCKLVDRIDFTRSKIFGEVLNRSDVLGDEVTHGRWGFPRRVVERGPLVFA